MSAVVIHDQVQGCFARKFLIDAAEELQKLLVPVALVKITDDLFPQADPTQRTEVVVPFRL